MEPGGLYLHRSEVRLATCWVFEHSLGVGVRVDDAPQEDGHVGDFVFGQLFQSGLQRRKSWRKLLSVIYSQVSPICD